MKDEKIDNQKRRIEKIVFCEEVKHVTEVFYKIKNEMLDLIGRYIDLNCDDFITNVKMLSDGKICFKIEGKCDGIVKKF